MQIIDKNGKIFGKINILDLAVFLFVLLLLFALAVNKLFPNRIPKAIRRMPQQKEFIVKVILGKERAWLVNYINIGDGQRDLENNFMAEVTNVEKFRIMGGVDSLLITLKLRASIDQGGFIAYGNNLLRPGEDFVLETRDYLLKGVVYSVQDPIN